MTVTYLKDLKIKIGLLPTDFKCLFWFSVVVFFPSILFLIFAREQLYELVIPYTGWSPGLLYFVILTLLSSDSKSSVKTDTNNLVSSLNIRYRIVFLLGIYLILGIFDWFTSGPEYYTHSNPYLRYDPLRPIFTILVPFSWMMIIGWPLAKDFYRNNLKFSNQ
jgi:hypothetical protein